VSGELAEGMIKAFDRPAEQERVFSGGGD